MIEHGPFNQLLKQGIYFTIENGPDEVYTGDLFYDVKAREFQVRGIPTLGFGKRHVFALDFRGPVLLDLVVKRVLEEEYDPITRYGRFRFLQGRCVGQFAAMMEERPQTVVAVEAMEANWDIVGDLTWFKS